MISQGGNVYNVLGPIGYDASTK